eukprot:TRINITY_DN45403_c0_g1_i1.p1 TRINITY_DN45403_c0_g1~~TRINITY_DN45403_c0_g1_i1.p1  ORF type:complete len:230 (+),score=38.96 TRINITY_DN45403_c0_g1_i1:43-690(+)
MEVFMRDVDDADRVNCIEVPDDARVQHLMNRLSEERNVVPESVVVLLSGDALPAATRLCDMDLSGGDGVSYKLVSPPFIVSRDSISDRNNTYNVAVLEDHKLVSAIHSVRAKASTFEDQGWGNEKGHVVLLLIRDGEQVCCESVFGVARQVPRENPPMLVTEMQRIADQSRVGDVLRCGYVVGGGGGHSLTVTGLHIVVFFKEPQAVDLEETGAL